MEKEEKAENLCKKIFEHEWLDMKCVENGCQSIVLEQAIQDFTYKAGEQTRKLLSDLRSLEVEADGLRANLQEAKFSLERIKEIASPLLVNKLIGKIYIDADNTLAALARTKKEP